MMSDIEMLRRYRRQRQIAGVIYPYLVVRNDKANAEKLMTRFQEPPSHKGYAASPASLLEWAEDSIAMPNLWSQLPERPVTSDLDWVRAFQTDFKRRGYKAFVERDLLSFVERGVQAVHLYGWLSGAIARHNDVWALMCVANMLYQVEVHEQIGDRHPFTGHLIMPETWGYSQWWNEEGVGPRYVEQRLGLQPTPFVPVSWRLAQRSFCGFVDVDANVCYEALFYAL